MIQDHLFGQVDVQSVLLVNTLGVGSGSHCVTTHSENKFANTAATFGKHRSHSRKRPSHSRQKRRTQSRTGQQQLANVCIQIYFLAALVNSTSERDTFDPFGKRTSANGRATFGKRRNYKREMKKYIVNSTLETDTFSKGNSANARATFGKRRDYKREMKKLVNSILETDTFGKRNSANS